MRAVGAGGLATVSPFMDFNTRVKLAVYGHFAATGQAPRLADIADELKCTSTGSGCCWRIGA